jgi:hypothetical protein
MNITAVLAWGEGDEGAEPFKTTAKKRGSLLIVPFYGCGTYIC